jgi:hypothetical protein
VTEPIDPHRPSAAKGGYSLASLALMVTVFAMLFASANFNPGGEQLAKLLQDGSWRLWGLLAGAVMVGAFVGLAHVLVHRFSWRALLFATISGGLAGGLGAMLLAAPGSIRQALIAVVVILGTTIVFRLGVE